MHTAHTETVELLWWLAGVQLFVYTQFVSAWLLVENRISLVGGRWRAYACMCSFSPRSRNCIYLLSNSDDLLVRNEFSWHCWCNLRNCPTKLPSKWRDSALFQLSWLFWFCLTSGPKSDFCTLWLASPSYSTDSLQPSISKKVFVSFNVKYFKEIDWI